MVSRDGPNFRGGVQQADWCQEWVCNTRFRLDAALDKCTARITKFLWERLGNQLLAHMLVVLLWVAGGRLRGDGAVSIMASGALLRACEWQCAILLRGLTLVVVLGFMPQLAARLHELDQVRFARLKLCFG
jgi:hypothetical protein